MFNRINGLPYWSFLIETLQSFCILIWNHIQQYVSINNVFIMALIVDQLKCLANSVTIPCSLGIGQLIPGKLKVHLSLVPSACCLHLPGVIVPEVVVANDNSISLVTTRNMFWVWLAVQLEFLNSKSWYLLISKSFVRIYKQSFNCRMIHSVILSECTYKEPLGGRTDHKSNWIDFRIDYNSLKQVLSFWFLQGLS